MRSMLAPTCLTRVVVDDEHAIEVAQLERARQRIQRALAEMAGHMPADMPAQQREYIASALLNLAVSRAPYTVAFRRECGATAS